MRFKLTLTTKNQQSVLPINYQYPLSAVIYRIIDSADASYAQFLHDCGYSKAGSLKKFKLFTFSDIRAPYQIKDDRFLLNDQAAELTVCFHMPRAAENFIRGLFLNQEIEIADRKSKACFTISQVESLQSPFETDGVQELVLQPLSPIVCGKKNEAGNYTFLSPEHPEFTTQLMYNWREKYRSIFGENDFEAEMEVLFYNNPPRSRLITIKENTEAETKIRGFVNFRLKVKAEKQAMELLMNSGGGLYNSIGQGCLGVV